MNVLISGGAKNGKSFFAQRLARQMAASPERIARVTVAGDGSEPDAATDGSIARPLYYVATMIPTDEEDRARIRRHVAERAGWGFETLEQGRDLMGLLAERDEGCADRNASADGRAHPADAAGEAHSVTALRNSAAGSADPAGAFLLDSVTALLGNEMFRVDEAGDFCFDAEAPARVAADCAAFARKTGNTVFVSDYIYGDAGRYDTMTEDYRRGLALVDRGLAAVCDWVIEVSAGVVEVWKSPIGDGDTDEADSRVSDGMGMLLLDPLPL